MEFRHITLDDKNILDDYLAKYPCLGSSYSMAYLVCWEYFNFESMEIASDANGLVLRFIDREKGTYNYMAQLTSKDNFPRVADAIFAYDSSASIVQLEGDYADLLDRTKYEIISNMDYAEYVYNTTDIITLQGKRYHGKRNHIKRFMNNYVGYVFRDYTDADKERVMALFEDWEEDKGLVINSEKNAILYMLDHMEMLGLSASVIEVNGDMIAFTLGEVTTAKVGIVHIEKANTDYEGAYPTINQLYATKHFGDTLYVNRQEDIGIEGLRKSKRSYYPVRMSEKCVVRLRKD